MKTKLLCLLIFSMTIVYSGYAVPTQLEMSNSKAISAIDFLKNQQVDLSIKSTTSGLTAKEIKKQKKLSKQIKRLEKKAAKAAGGTHDWGIAILLSALLGMLGVDRFYLGRVFTGILKLITLGGFFIWYLIDIILIITRVLKPKNGSYSG